MKNTEVRTLHSEIVNEDFRVHVRLPSRYASCEAVYPVLYAVDADRRFPLAAHRSKFLEFPADHVTESIIPELKTEVSIVAGGTRVTAVPQAWTEALPLLIRK